MHPFTYRAMMRDRWRRHRYNPPPTPTDSLDSLEATARTDPPSWHDPMPRLPLGRNSATMCRGRNDRRRSFGYEDVYSMRDRNWPTGARGYERKLKLWKQREATRGLIRSGGEGI